MCGICVHTLRQCDAGEESLAICNATPEAFCYNSPLVRRGLSRRKVCKDARQELPWGSCSLARQSLSNHQNLPLLLSPRDCSCINLPKFKLLTERPFFCQVSRPTFHSGNFFSEQLQHPPGSEAAGAAPWQREPVAGSWQSGSHPDWKLH